VEEGKRLAREAALSLLSELDVADDQESPVDDAMEFCHLEQHLLPEQLPLPFDAPADVRGILDIGGMNVFVKGSRPPRIRWVGAHEIGHYAIPEHNDLLRFCSTFDLSAEARRHLEVEANVFAAEFLFQGRRFVEQCMSQPFSIDMLRTMSTSFGVSYEAGFRRFVEDNPKPVALLVSVVLPAEPESRDGRVILDFGARRTRLRYGAYSRQFMQRYGFAPSGQIFDTEHPVSHATASGESTGAIRFRDEVLSVHSFYNQYDVLSIVRPGAKR